MKKIFFLIFKICKCFCSHCFTCFSGRMRSLILVSPRRQTWDPGNYPTCSRSHNPVLPKSSLEASRACKAYICFLQLFRTQSLLWRHPGLGTFTLGNSELHFQNPQSNWGNSSFLQEEARSDLSLCFQGTQGHWISVFHEWMESWEAGADQRTLNPNGVSSHNATTQRPCQQKTG